MVTYSDTGAGAATPASIAYEYDLNGNVRRNYFQYTQLDAQGNANGTIPRDFWYLYDAMNRFTLTKGQFTGTRGSGTISSAPDSSGMVLTYYLDGQRATKTSSTNQTWTDPETQDVFPYIRNQTETYSYTTDGYLAEMDISYSHSGDYADLVPDPAGGEIPQQATYTRDAMGRVTDYKEFTGYSSTQVYERVSTFNNKSEVTEDDVTAVQGSNTWLTTTDYDYNLETSSGSGVWTGTYMGTVTHSTAFNRLADGTNTSHSELKNSFG